MSSHLVLATVCISLLPTLASAQLVATGQFSTTGSGVSCAYDPATNTVFTYGSFAADIRRYTPAGVLLGTLPRPGQAANDVDLEIAPVSLQLGTTVIPAGTLLFIEGETGTADIYAVDPLSGAVLASLTTNFGASHVVGGAFHPQRGTFFLVQDRVPSGAAQDNLVGEIDPISGAVLVTFQTTTTQPSFTVNYGDLDITANGNLLIVSSDESEIGEFSVGGQWLVGHPLPTGSPTVSSLAGIGIDDSGCDLWVISDGGTVTRLSGTCPTATQLGSGCASSGGVNTLAVSAPAWTGTTFRAVATNLPTLCIAATVTGLSALPAPVPLPALLAEGVAGCNLYVAPDFFAASVVTTGTYTTEVPLPASPSVVGFAFWQQLAALELDPTSLQIVAATSTNALAVTVGSY